MLRTSSVSPVAFGCSPALSVGAMAWPPRRTSDVSRALLKRSAAARAASSSAARPAITSSAAGSAADINRAQV